MTTFIVFDVGNVVVIANQKITYGILEEYGVPKDRAAEFFDIKEYNDFSRGKITGKEFYNALIQKFGVKLSYKQIVHAHNEHIFGIDSEVVKILSKLPKEKLAFLTDTNEWQTEREKELIDLKSYSNLVFRSHEIHMLKTDKNCFPYVISQLCVEPNEILLIDDSIEKVEMAKQHGIQTLQFKDAGRLSDYLKDNRLL